MANQCSIFCTSVAVLNFLHKRGGFAKSVKTIAPVHENHCSAKSSKTDGNLPVLAEKVGTSRAVSPLFFNSRARFRHGRLSEPIRTRFGHVSDASWTLLWAKKQTASRGIVVCFGIRVPLASARARAPTGNRRHIHPLLRTHDVPHHACMQTTSSPTCIQPHEHRAYTLHCHGATPMRRHPLTRHRPTMDNITVMSLSLHPSPRGLCCPSE